MEVVHGNRDLTMPYTLGGGPMAYTYTYTRT